MSYYYVLYICIRIYIIYTFRYLSKLEFYYIYDDDECTGGCVFAGYRIFHAQTFTLRKWIRIARRFFDFYFRHVSFAKICPPPPRRFRIRTLSVGYYSLQPAALLYYFYLARAFTSDSYSEISRIDLILLLYSYPTVCVGVCRCVCVCVWEIERANSWTFQKA